MCIWRWSNVGYPRWANVILLIRPTLAQLVGMTLGQRGFVPHFHWANVGPNWVCTTLPLGQCWANVVVTRVCCIFIAPTLGQHGFVLHFHWANVLYFHWASVELMHTYSMGVFCWANVCLFCVCVCVRACVRPCVRACVRACVCSCAETLDIGYVVYKQYACNEYILVLVVNKCLLIWNCQTWHDTNDTHEIVAT